MKQLEPWGLVDEVVLAVGGRDESLSEIITRNGPSAVADLLAAEILCRGEAPRGVGNTSVNLTIEHDGELFRFAAMFKDGQMSVERGSAGDAIAEVRYSMLDLVRSLYPHRPGRESTSRDVREQAWPWMREQGGLIPLRYLEIMQSHSPETGPFAIHEEQLADLSKATQSVISACSDAVLSLDELAARFGSDKWGGLHWFTPHYERHLGHLRHDPVKVLEIGIGGFKWESLGGRSLRMWQQFFPRGLVYGMDIHSKPKVTGPRIRTIQGDQNDPGFLRDMAEQIGPFDVVIDDGSHVNEHVRTSFEALFEFVRPGGYYIVEDLQTSYWPAFGGEDPPGSRRTTMGLLKDLLDSIHVGEHIDEAMTPPTHPSSVHVYHNLAFLHKGKHERGAPAWLKAVAGSEFATD